MSHQTKNASGTSQHAGQAIANRTDDFEAAAHSAVHSAAESVRNVTDKVKDAAGQVSDRVQQSVEYGQTRTKEIKKGFEHTVAAHPIKAIAIAAGAGLLVGWLWRRR